MLRPSSACVTGGSGYSTLLGVAPYCAEALNETSAIASHLIAISSS